MEKVADKPTEIALPANYRYERKFIYQNTTPEDLIATEVLNNGFCFREIFHRRTVNNCYFDDLAMSFYHQNVAGDDKRDKYRLRWYGDVFNRIEKPVLEIKKKHGAVGDKLSFGLSGMNTNLAVLSASGLLSEVQDAIQKNHSIELANNMKVLRPALYNGYERRYFLSHCERFRITIDYNMKFYNPHITPFTATETALSDIVLELKYAVQDDKEARILSQGLSARLSKHSKYVRGVDLIHHQQYI